MANLMPFKLVVPEGTMIDGEVIEVHVPTPGGTIAVMADHMPLVTPVSTGVVALRHDEQGKVDHYAIAGGVLTVDDNGTTIAATAADHADSIDQLEAQKALTEARAALTTILTDEEVAMTEGAIEISMARLEAFDRHKVSKTRH